MANSYQPKKIRVLVVDDSIMARSLITSGLGADPRIEVVGTAISAADAKNKVVSLRPDVMTLDVEMPGMSGIDFIKQEMRAHPLPVILVSSLDIKVFEALAAGAVDFIRKPEGNREQFISTLRQKIMAASMARVHTPRRASAPPTQPISVPNLGASPILDRVIIGLGASTGGTEATLEVLRHLPADTPGMVIVQHMPTGFVKMYAERLNRLCSMEVREAVSGDTVRRGLALIAPADFQTKVVRMPNGRYTVSCAEAAKMNGHRPSVDFLFQSIADSVQCRTAGIILTGMGQDGAAGLLAMRKKGAYTIGQDKESSVVYGMPMVAYNIGAVQTQCAIENVAGTLIRHLKSLT